MYYNQYSKTLLISVLLFFTISCSSVVEQNQGQPTDSTSTNSEWLIPSDRVFVGASRDEIASLDDPAFQKPSEVNFLEPEELVLGLKVGDEIKAYPNIILYYHEIVNDTVDGKPVAVTYCPLTGSGLAWDRTIDGQTTTFGVSGLIYKNNLIAYDRNTNSYWSQMKASSVKGVHSGDRLQTIHLIEMQWEAWQKAFPNSKVLTGNGNKTLSYEQYLYGGDYPSNNQRILFPIGQEDDRLDRKTLAHGLYYNSDLIVFPIKNFQNELTVSNKSISSTDIVLIGNRKHKLATSYSRILDDGTELSFEKVTDSFPIVMQDDSGTNWNIFGEAVNGPLKGKSLTPLPSYNAYWFAWVDFFKSGPKTPVIAIP
ncbi:MAG: DUF3179 domain-containing protein [Fodinibius sp.]|nr:DUF3179 domain-containing protein [Fodinibius sp.]